MIELAATLLLLQQVPDIARETSREVARQECRPSEKEEVVVCGQRGRSPYRLPEPPQQFDPFGDAPSVMAERQAWAEEGDSGTQSCGPVGPGGWTGCMVKAWKRQRDQTQWGKNIPKKRW